VGPDHRQWLESVIEACNQVINDGARSEDPWLTTIIVDATELRDRLQRELNALPRENAP
jgi:hypothetical protein